MSVQRSFQRRVDKRKSSDYRRLSPTENVKAGFSPKARHYVLKTVKRITKNTVTITEKKYRTKKDLETYGFTPEQATEARKQGAISYVSQGQKERVSKAANTRQGHKVDKRSGEYIPSSNPSVKRRGQTLSPAAIERYKRNRQRKLDGDFLDWKEWFELIDIATATKNAKLPMLRQSPPAAYTIGK